MVVRGEHAKPGEALKKRFQSGENTIMLVEFYSFIYTVNNEQHLDRLV